MGDHETAVKFYNQAVACVNDTRDNNHLTTAYQLFSSARLVDPDWFDANYQCGNNNSDLGKIEAQMAEIMEEHGIARYKFSDQEMILKRGKVRVKIKTVKVEGASNGEESSD